MENCEKYIGLISELIDGEISVADRSELEIHLEFCPECRKVAKAFAAISDGFPTEEKVPANFTEGTMAKIKAEAAKPVGIKKFISGYGKYTGLAAALVVILLGAQVFNGGSRDTAAPMAPMAMVAGSAAEAENHITADSAAVGFASKAEADSAESFTVSAGGSLRTEDDSFAPAGADVPESEPMNAPAEEAAPEEMPAPEPSAAPQFSVTVSVTDVNELYKARGYTERFYSVSHIKAPVPENITELLNSSVATEIYSSEQETHYCIPMETLNNFDPELFTEIVFDDLTAQNGLLIVMHEE